MNNVSIEVILEFAEELVYRNTGSYLSELQRIIILTTLQGSRKTYVQIADECGYSAKYIKQYVAPKLWQLLSQVIGEKVTKLNAKAILEKELRQHSSWVQFSFGQSQGGLADTGYRIFSTFESSNPPEQGLNAQGIHSGTSILLVDDQPNNLDVLSSLLEEQGFDVRQAINGSVALQAVSITLPDLILLDINMPELDGYTVCQSLKADSKTQHIPIIFVSALDETWDKVKAFSVGGSDYITKPFKVVEVLARVENQLKIRDLQKELLSQSLQLESEKQLRLNLEAQLHQAHQELDRLRSLDIS